MILWRTHSLTNSVTYSLTNELTHSLTDSLFDSLDGTYNHTHRMIKHLQFLVNGFLGTVLTQLKLSTSSVQN